jgi:hypothetical protein
LEFVFIERHTLWLKLIEKTGKKSCRISAVERNLITSAVAAVNSITSGDSSPSRHYFPRTVPPLQKVTVTELKNQKSC